MPRSTLTRKPEDILGDLIGLTAEPGNRESILNRLTDLCREAFNAEACTLAEINLERRFLKQIACSGFNQEFRYFMADKKIPLAPEGGTLDFDLLAPAKIIEKYNLQKTGGGVANVEIARRWGLNSALCYPLRKHAQNIRFLNIFSKNKTPFKQKEKIPVKKLCAPSQNHSGKI